MPRLSAPPVKQQPVSPFTPSYGQHRGGLGISQATPSAAPPTPPMSGVKGSAKGKSKLSDEYLAYMGQGPGMMPLGGLGITNPSQTQAQIAQVARAQAGPMWQHSIYHGPGAGAVSAQAQGGGPFGTAFNIGTRPYVQNNQAAPYAPAYQATPPLQNYQLPTVQPDMKGTWVDKAGNPYTGLKQNPNGTYSGLNASGQEVWIDTDGTVVVVGFNPTQIYPASQTHPNPTARFTPAYLPPPTVQSSGGGGYGGFGSRYGGGGGGGGYDNSGYYNPAYDTTGLISWNI